MNILFLLSSIFSQVFPIELNEELEVYRNLSEKTVVLVKTTVMVKNNSTLEWKEADSSIPLMTTLKIAKTGGMASNERTGLFDDKKYDPHNVFFFTSYEGSGLYSFEFDVNSNVPNTYGLKLEIFEGNPRNPEIMSGIDYHMSMLTHKVGDLLNFARQNFEMEQMGEKDEVEYVRLYNYIFTLVFRISILKIVTLFVTIFYFNKSVKKFFITSKIAK